MSPWRTRTTKEGIGVYLSSPFDTNPSSSPSSPSTSSPTPVSTCHRHTRSHRTTTTMSADVGESSAGPSGSRISQSVDAGSRWRMNDIVDDGTDNQKSKRRKCHCRRRRLTPLIATIPPFLLPFLPTTAAAPAPPPPSSRRPSLVRNDVQTPSITNDPTPIFPPIIDVDENALPLLLTQKPDGTWERDQGGWLLYGRRGVASTTASTTTTTTTTSSTGAAIASFAVVSVLPNGWGSTSSRTSIYKVPLIVVASCVIAMAIVAFLIFIVISRRRRHRREKRAKERMRCKALAAAGLSEADINDTAAKAAFKEKLAELEAQRKSMIKNKNRKTVSGSSGKIRGWNKRIGLRRRKGTQNKVDGDTVIEEDSSINMARLSPQDPQDSDQPSVHSPSSTETEQDTANEQASGSHASGSQASGSEASGSQASGPQASASQASASPVEQGTTLSTPYFPPAYRPASVRSTGAIAGPSNSHSRFSPAVDADTDTNAILSGPEKTQAPGYYPAPATEDGEVALAVASRSDGKARMIDPLPLSDVESNSEAHEDPTTRHVATDDKRVLEQLRLGASAPPTFGSDVLAPVEERADYLQGLGIELEPSAPSVHLDVHGFELSDSAEEQESTSSTAPASTLFPPPPTLRTRRSSPAPSPLPSPMMDNSQHLLPSAPPAHDDDGEDAHVPSAPPIPLDDGDEGDSGDVSVPSAPPLEEEEETEPIAQESGGEERQRGRESREESASSNDLNGGQPTIYLPRYEP